MVCEVITGIWDEMSLREKKTKKKISMHITRGRERNGMIKS